MVRTATNEKEEGAQTCTQMLVSNIIYNNQKMRIKFLNVHLYTRECNTDIEEKELLKSLGFRFFCTYDGMRPVFHRLDS